MGGMKILVTGSAGHLGEALVRVLRGTGNEVAGVDITSSPYTDVTASVTDRVAMRRLVKGRDAVIHAASLHKPHMATHSKQQFVDVNIGGTLALLDEAAAARVGTFIYTSTTSVYGRALEPAPGAPAVWITEAERPVPRNIYGVTKKAAEELCEMFHRTTGMRCIVLRTSRFFPEEDDRRPIREGYADGNVKANEFLYRRVEIEDVVSAHRCAIERAGDIGFGVYVISATTPFTRADLAELRTDAPRVVKRRAPQHEAEYARRGWKMFPGIDRVYVNGLARDALGWAPRHDFAYVIDRLAAREDPRSELARAIGSKGYHDEVFEDGPFPVEG
jgi:UDP-glucose 4-epimerase